MKWLEVKVIIVSGDKHVASDLIADIFHDIGLTGVVMEDGAGWSERDGAGRQPPRPDAVTAYLPMEERLPQRMERIQHRLAELTRRVHIRHHMVCRDVDEEDWAESWKAYFRPQRIGRKIVIKPTWWEYVPSAGDVIVEIDPGMAFGTGTHPTTSLCLQMIEAYLRKGDSFLDVGTGSGILMATAAKLGAARIAGVDDDVLAVGIARKNLLLNNIKPEKFLVIAGHLAEPFKGRFNLVAANILTETIVGLLDHIGKNLVNGGMLICSGIVAEKKDLILSRMEKAGFDLVEAVIEEQWLAVAGKKPDNLK